MRRQARATLLLALAVLALGGMAWWQLRREAGGDLPRLLAGFDAAAVQSIRVRTVEGPLRRFERQGRGWRMREPYDLPAESEAVERLLGIASAPLRKRLEDAAPDLRKLGLAPPQATVDYAGIAAQHLEFGATDAIRGERYVRRGDAIWLVPDRFSAWLFAPAENELDRRVAAGSAPVALRLDGVDRPDLLAAWQAVAATRVLAAAEVPAPAGAMHTVELRASDGSVRALTLWRGDVGYCVRRRDLDLVYVYDESAVQALLAPAP